MQIPILNTFEEAIAFLDILKDEKYIDDLDFSDTQNDNKLLRIFLLFFSACKMLNTLNLAYNKIDNNITKELIEAVIKNNSLNCDQKSYF